MYLQLALAAEFRPECSYSWKVPWFVGVVSAACCRPGVISTMSSSLVECALRPLIALAPWWRNLLRCYHKKNSRVYVYVVSVYNELGYNYLFWIRIVKRSSQLVSIAEIDDIFFLQIVVLDDTLKSRIWLSKLRIKAPVLEKIRTHRFILLLYKGKFKNFYKSL